MSMILIMGFKDTHVGNLNTKVVPQSNFQRRKRKKGKSIFITVNPSNIEQFEC